MKTKQIFVLLLSLGIVLSGVSVANAVGMWSNPTATPTGNNVDAPINVGTSAQDKAGVLRVTGFRSFFDAIFDNKVQIGNAAAVVPANLKLLVSNAMGTGYYCDELGANCFTPSQVTAVINNTNTNTTGPAGGTGGTGTPGGPGTPGGNGTPGTTGGGDSCTAADKFDSGWLSKPASSHKLVTHNLGTEDTVVYLEMKSPPFGYTGGIEMAGGPDQYNISGSNNAYTGAGAYWAKKTENTIQVIWYGTTDSQLRIKIKKDSCW